jgi:hypothetical protein
VTIAIRRSKRRLAIMSMLATGWLPWGTRWTWNGEVPSLPLCGKRYVMCCGHALGSHEAGQFLEAGLLAPGEPDSMGRATLVITEAGRLWLRANW